MFKVIRFVQAEAVYKYNKKTKQKCWKSPRFPKKQRFPKYFKKSVENSNISNNFMVMRISQTVYVGNIRNSEKH